MRKKLTTYIEEENIKELKKIALEKECSVADILDELVKKYLEKEKNKEVNWMGNSISVKEVREYDDPGTLPPL